LNKLRLNKKFRPFECNIGDEIFRNGIFEFNITKLLEYIDTNKSEFTLEEVDVKDTRTFPSSDLDEGTIESAHLSNPIILAEISPSMFNVIDGNHRLEKAYRVGVDKIVAYKLLAEQHISFITSFDAYEEYVQYWNEKVKMYKLYSSQ